ncbi:MAG TPA: mandelate racemase/muconate lactonizing enzyme family protein [Verrucomicrobiae bacterium]|jgi:L-alanine-DL-glutamate epimerase-like enolase superfamily enzyme|nr:mandelate racemase/muconate lactonizing enzyme family protein [Verrucomicrobiae bacterium]
MRITAVRASWLRAPIPAAAAHVSDFGRNDSFNMCLVEIDTDAGITGLGEAKAAVGNLGNYAAIVTLIREEFAPLLVGRDPRDITGAWDLLYNGTRAHYAAREGRTFPTIGRRGVTLSAVSGVDIALWDILGRSLDVPLWRLMGGRYRDRVPAYASGGWAPVGGIGKQMVQYVERGHRAVKMRVGLQDASVDDSAARVAEARETLGSGVGIMVDAHGTWSVREAQRFARKVEAYDLAWLEEPVSPDNLAGQAEVRAATDIPIAAGESEQTRFAFREMLDARAVDILQPDPAIAGGITEVRTIAGLAASQGLTMAPHLWGSAILFATGLHLCVSTPCATILEYSRGHNPLLNDLVEEEIAFADGHVLAPTGPGLGLTLRRDFVERVRVAV